MKRISCLIPALLTLNAFTQIRQVCTLRQISEVSGLMRYKGQLWALNDGQNAPAIYLVDTTDGNVLDSTTFSNVSNVDWEELCSNDSQIFIGDFGNNNGSRKDLKIYRFPAASLGNKWVHCDTIGFYYPLQNQFNPNPLTLYDCEAMLALEDSIYLFSKSIADGICRQYALPNQPGYHAARLVDSVSPEFWVTGICRIEGSAFLIGYGYNGTLTPQMQQHIFSENRLLQPPVRKVKFTYTGPSQIESCVALSDHLLWLAAETSDGFPAALLEFGSANAIDESPHNSTVRIIPNPSVQGVNIYLPKMHSQGRVLIYDSAGRLVHKQTFKQEDQVVSAVGLKPGSYFYRIQDNSGIITAKFFLP